jgi:hypothetical protein
MIALFTKVISDEILSKLREDSSSDRAPGNKGKHLIVVLVLDFLPPADQSDLGSEKNSIAGTSRAISSRWP